MVRFGDFKTLCEHTPSYPWCNLFYRQVLSTKSHRNQLIDRITYSSRRTHQLYLQDFLPIQSLLQSVSTRNVAFQRATRTVHWGTSPICLHVVLAWSSSPLSFSSPLDERRRSVRFFYLSWLAASGMFNGSPSTGRSEFRIFLIAYLISLLLQLITTGALLQQGSSGLVVLTALHAGTIAALFWVLLGNSLVSMQVVEDGTTSSLIVRPFQPFIRLLDVPLCIVPDL